MLFTIQALTPCRRNATYEVHWQIVNRKTTAQGGVLMRRFDVPVSTGDGGERIVYRQVKNR